LPICAAGLSLIKFFWWAPSNDFFRKSAFQPFKVIQGHWFWYESKVRMRFPISPS